MNFRYRRLGPEDAQAWQDLRIEGARDFPLGFLLTVEEAAAATLDRCRDLLAGGGFRGVFEDDTLIGFCGLRFQQLSRIWHRGELGPFFVTRSRQGSGAARVLMGGVVHEAAKRGLAQLELFVDSENHRAIAFYERHGFARVAIHRDSVRIAGQSRDDIFYTLRLNP